MFLKIVTLTEGVSAGLFLAVNKHAICTVNSFFLCTAGHIGKLSYMAILPLFD